MDELSKIIGNNNVHDLCKENPVSVFERKDPLEKWLCLCCGGDGTLAWILSVLDQFVFDENACVRPRVAIIPLGTGNDLSRSLGWGPGWTSDVHVNSLLERIEQGRTVQFDRWRVYVTKLDAKGKPLSTSFYCMQNYLSFGCDAAVCSQFHQLRETLPSLCSSRLGNKVLYTLGGTKAFFEEHAPLEKVIRLYCDGEKVKIPADVFGLMILNINSYAGGADLWGSEEEGFIGQRSDDGLLEVVGVSGTFHLGAGAVGLAEGRKVCQGKDLRLEFTGVGENIEGEEPHEHNVFYQLDGEPAEEPLSAPAIVRIRLIDNKTTFIVPQLMKDE